MSSHKQVIVMRKDLNMRKGKIAAQAAHASMAAILSQGEVVSKRSDENSPWFHELRVRVDERSLPWLAGNFKKVCVYVTSEAELLALHEKAKSLGIITALITDSGLTEFNGVPTNTCIAVGPDYEDKIDKVTGGLPLL